MEFLFLRAAARAGVQQMGEPFNLGRSAVAINRLPSGVLPRTTAAI
ncbi:hypothetical protein [Phenylobacterium sp. RIFCSPHIGHO2_01_FULL_69_31]|jgi:hypothetical protein|nr:hypothetical protein [Phenylobacterium sp. RIFCSPHIGHO2_01_FULL_69_31]